jgi:type I restriction enzyme, S subunit
VKKGWKEQSLVEMCSVLSGLWKGKKKPFETATVIRNTNFTKDCRLDLEDVAVLDVESRQLAKRRLRPGDLILEKSGGGPKQPVGRVVYFDEPKGVYSFSNFTAVLRVNDPSAIAPDYLQRFLYWRYMIGATEPMQRRSTGIRNLDMAAYMAMPVAYPPLAEQRRIVAILEEAFEGIAAAKANAEKNLRNAKEVIEAEVEETFDQEEGSSHSLDDVCRIDSALVDPRKAPYREMLHVGGANMVSGSGGLIDLKTASTEALISGKFAFGEGAVLYSKIRPYLRKVARPDFIGLCSADVYPLTPQAGRLDRDYLYYLLLSPQFTEYAVAGSARAGMPKVNRPHLFAYRLTLPDLKRQRQIADRLDAIGDSAAYAKGLFEQKLAALDELKASLLHQAFTGQL